MRASPAKAAVKVITWLPIPLPLSRRPASPRERGVSSTLKGTGNPAAAKGQKPCNGHSVSGCYRPTTKLPAALILSTVSTKMWAQWEEGLLLVLFIATSPVLNTQWEVNESLRPRIYAWEREI